MLVFCADYRAFVCAPNVARVRHGPSARVHLRCARSLPGLADPRRRTPIASPRQRLPAQTPGFARESSCAIELSLGLSPGGGSSTIHRRRENARRREDELPLLTRTLRRFPAPPLPPKLPTTAVGRLLFTSPLDFTSPLVPHPRHRHPTLPPL